MKCVSFLWLADLQAYYTKWFFSIVDFRSDRNLIGKLRAVFFFGVSTKLDIHYCNRKFHSWLMRWKMCNVIQGALKWCKRELDSRVMWSDCVWIDDNDNDRRHSIRLDEAQLMAVYVTCCYEEMFHFDAFVESWSSWNERVKWRKIEVITLSIELHEICNWNSLNSIVKRARQKKVERAAATGLCDLSD